LTGQVGEDGATREEELEEEVVAVYLHGDKWNGVCVSSKCITFGRLPSWLKGFQRLFERPVGARKRHILQFLPVISKKPL
jgi:hypothetical protein